MNPCLYDQFMYDKQGKNMQWGKDSFFNNDTGKTGQIHAKKNEAKPCTTTPQNKDLNVRPETMILLKQRQLSLRCHP